jgi:uncharacterized protein (TIGR02466 family)
MIHHIFPSLVYKENLECSLDNEYLYQQALRYSQTTELVNEWDSGMYNSLGAVNLMQDKEFQKVVNLCKLHVRKFALEYGIDMDITCSDCWVNVYKPGDYQEIHVHEFQHFSAVYYVRVPPESGGLMLSGVNTMFPLPVTSYESSFYIEPKESDLVIFRSHTPHRVSRNKSDQIRVSIAMNFRY